MRLLVVNLPALHKSICLEYNDNTTQDVECYLIDVPKGADLRAVPTQPDESARVPLTPLICANMVLAIEQMIRKVNQDG